MLRILLRTLHRIYIERIMLSINVIIILNGIEDIFLLDEFIVSEYPMWEGVPTLWSVGSPCHRA
jgi:hypothetical protein